MLVTPLMSCSARLPVYSVFIGTFVPEEPVIPGLLGLQALTLFGLYILGIVTAVAVAWILRKTILRGERPPFVLELPSYKWPSPLGLLLRLRDRGREFLVRAGTAILRRGRRVTTAKGGSSAELPPFVCLVRGIPSTSVTRPAYRSSGDHLGEFRASSLLSEPEPWRDRRDTQSMQGTTTTGMVL